MRALRGLAAVLRLLVRPLAWAGASTAVAGAVFLLSAAAIVMVVVVSREEEAEEAPPVSPTRAPDRAQAGPGATPTPSLPAATSTPTLTPSPPPTATPTATPSATPTATPTATLPPGPTPAPTATAPRRVAPPSPPPELRPGQEVAFLGAAPEDEEQAAIRDELARIVAFFDERFGIVVPGFTVYASTDSGPLAADYEERHERDAPAAHGWGGWALGLRDGTNEAYVVLPDGHPSPAVLAHAYYRLLQHHLMHSLGGEYLSAPGWLIEGTAAYGETLYSLQGGTGQADFVNRWEALVVGDTSITDVIGDDAANRERMILGHPDGAALDASHHQLVASGIAWLVERAGNDDAHLEYWRLLAAAGDSNRAFASAFGMTVDTFLEAFEAYRADAAATLPLVQGVLTDLAGEPLPGTRVEVIPIDTAERTTGTYSALATFRARGVGASAATTAHDGSFAIPVLPDWRYLVYLPRLFPSASDAPAGGAFPGLPVDPETGAVNRCGPLSFLVVGSDNVSNLEINVLFQLLTMQERPVCGRAPTIVQLAGIVRAPDAGPAARVRVCAYQYSSASEDCASSGEDGTFALRVPPGEIWLRLHSTRRVSGWYGDGTWVRHQSQRTPIPVGGSGIRGLEVRMRAFLFGRVVGPDSGLLIARYLIVCTEHASPAAGNDCTGIEDDGSFFVAVAPGAVSLQVLTTAGELGWYGEDGGLTSKEERAVIQVAGSHVSDIEIHLH